MSAMPIWIFSRCDLEHSEVGPPTVAPTGTRDSQKTMQKFAIWQVDGQAQARMMFVESCNSKSWPLTFWNIICESHDASGNGNITSHCTKNVPHVSKTSSAKCWSIFDVHTCNVCFSPTHGFLRAVRANDWPCHSHMVSSPLASLGLALRRCHDSVHIELEGWMGYSAESFVKAWFVLYCLYII